MIDVKRTRTAQMRFRFSIQFTGVLHCLARVVVVAFLGSFVPLEADEVRLPKLQIINGSDQTIDVFWLKSDTERVSNGSAAPGQHTIISTTLGHRFAVVGQADKVERLVTSEVPVQALRFDPPDEAGIPTFYTQRAQAGGFPIVASAAVNPYALKEAAYLVDLMLAERPDVRSAFIKSGARLSILAWNEFTTEQPEWKWLAEQPVPGFTGISARDYRDARARHGRQRDRSVLFVRRGELAWLSRRSVCGRMHPHP